MAVIYLGESAPRTINELELVAVDLDSTLFDVRDFEFGQRVRALKWAEETGIVPPMDREAKVQRMVYADVHSAGDASKYYELLFGAEVPVEFWSVHRQNIRELRHLQRFTFLGKHFLELLHVHEKRVVAWTSRESELLEEEYFPALHKSTTGEKITKLFEFIISASDVAHLKPDPEGLDVIHERTGVPYERIVMIGDRDSDTKPAKQRGAKAMALARNGNPDTVAAQYEAGADGIAENLFDYYQLWFPEDLTHKN